MDRLAQYPNAVPGLAAAGPDALRAAMGTYADWQIRAGCRFDPDLADATALAANLIQTLEYPEHSFDGLPEDAQDRVAIALGLPACADWAPREPIPEGTPSYRMPSWEKDVYEVLYLKHVEPPPTRRPVAAARPDATVEWPQLATVAAWAGTRAKASIGKALAARLGRAWSLAQPYGPLRLPLLRNDDLDLAFVVVPGGDLEMGLSKADRASAARLAKRLGPEATEHVAALSRSCRPLRTVSVSPFLVAQTPVLAAQAARLGIPGDTANPHDVLRCGSADTATAVPDGFRLPSEAEWEWLARAGEQRTWLSGSADPADWAAAVLSEPLGAEEAHRFGAYGLGWGEWVDDGWHATYRGGPADSRAWDPVTRPEVVRGGCLALWPWQGAEAMLALTAGRDRAGSGAQHAIRLARDLPAR